MANGVDATVNTVQPPPLRPSADRTRPHADPEQLRVAHDTVLPPGERRDPVFEWGFGRLIPHSGTK
jgi:hypothetical protein